MRSIPQRKTLPKLAIGAVDRWQRHFGVGGKLNYQFTMYDQIVGGFHQIPREHLWEGEVSTGSHA